LSEPDLKLEVTKKSVLSASFLDISRFQTEESVSEDNFPEILEQDGLNEKDFMCEL
jgi:hypothetical protein